MTIEEQIRDLERNLSRWEGSPGDHSLLIEELARIAYIEAQKLEQEIQEQASGSYAGQKLLDLVTESARGFSHCGQRLSVFRAKFKLLKGSL